MKTPKKDEERGEYRFYPDLDDQPRGDADLSPWVPKGVFETGLAPVPEEYAEFPWPKGYPGRDEEDGEALGAQPTRDGSLSPQKPQ